MTPNTLYSYPSQSEDHDFNILKGCYYDFVPEIIDNWYNNMIIPEDCKITIKHIKEHHFDHKRFWRLSTVWFNNVPIMVIQNAGRIGDDHAKRFITDEISYLEMVMYIKTLIPIEKMQITDVYNINDDLNLTEFYGNRLDGYFDYY